ncbi:hypothetical protein R3W88_004202 [Solanum pinnatisectum]|uniref:Uncharacterized protein n=1 Tax=Solanum pinnatisectum TaxID=50273 RepID=A0AAV9K8T6_9SOLN|nr:hypothetical protein R3W88_004202 [Solanum pinnatisectum]
MQQSKEGGKQTNNNSKERKGKFVNFSPKNYDHNNILSNNLHNSQNEHEKGQSVMQAGANVIDGQIEKTTMMDVSRVEVPKGLNFQSLRDGTIPRHIMMGSGNVSRFSNAMISEV